MRSQKAEMRLSSNTQSPRKRTKTVRPTLRKEVGAERQRSPGKTFTSGSATLVYYEEGGRTGRPLVVVAGGPGFDQKYLHLGTAWGLIGAHHRLVFYDQRGTGRASPVGAGDQVTVADFVADLEALREALHVNKIDLLGHSFGGYLAMAYAAQFPIRVAHLVLVDAVPPRRSETLFLFEHAFPERAERWQAWRAALNTGDTAAAAAGKEVYLSMLFYSPTNRDRWIRQAASVGFNPQVCRLLWSEVAGPDLTDELGKFQFPALVVTGRYDMNVAPLTAWRIHLAIPGSEFVVFERSGHLPCYEEAAEFAAVLNRFLSHR